MVLTWRDSGRFRVGPRRHVQGGREGDVRTETGKAPMRRVDGKRRSSGGSRAEPRGGSSSSIRSERARGRCGRNYQHKSLQPSCTSGSKLTHVAGKAQCCEHDAAATLPSPERAQLFLRIRDFRGWIVSPRGLTVRWQRRSSPFKRV